MVQERTEKFSILKVTEQDNRQTEDTVVREFPLTIILNGQELVTLLCTPANLKCLAIGFLTSEGIINNQDDIEKITVDERHGVARVGIQGNKRFASETLSKRLITSGCGNGATFYREIATLGQLKVNSQTSLSAPAIFALVKEFQHRSKVYQTTGGVHSAALCDTDNILVFAEDIGRHNAIDKIFGECLLGDIPTSDRIIITSGRISSEIMLKIVRRNVPLLISKSAPTNLGLKLASNMGITLIGFVRGHRMNVYSNEWRISTNEK